MNSRRTTLPIPTERIEQMRTSLSPRYGFETWDGRESGSNERILVVRVPGNEPDLVNDLEAAVEYVAPGDLQGVRTLLLVGNQRNLTVSGQPFKDLMSARVQADKRLCAAVRPQLREPMLHRAPEDPHRLLRLMVPINRRQVRDMDDSDLDGLAEAMGPHLDDPEWLGARCVYLLAAEDDVRIDADLFFQDLTQRAHDLAERRKAAKAEQEAQLAARAQQEMEAMAAPEANAQANAQSQGSPATTTASTPPFAAQGAVHTHPHGGGRQQASEWTAPPGRRSGHAEQQLAASPMDGLRIGDAEKRALFAELERRYGKRVAYAPMRRMRAGLTWEAEAESDVMASGHDAGHEDRTAGFGGAPAGVLHAPGHGADPRLEEIRRETDRLPRAPAWGKVHTIDASEDPLAGMAIQTENPVHDASIPSARDRTLPLEAAAEAATLMGTPQAPLGAPDAAQAASAGAAVTDAPMASLAVSPTVPVDPAPRVAQPPPDLGPTAPVAVIGQPPADAPSSAAVPLPIPPQGPLGRLHQQLASRGFDVLADPRVPGHLVDLAAERPSGYPQRVIARLPDKLTLEVADEVLASSRALDVDLALVVCSEADAEARERLIATKAKWISPLDIPNLAV